MRNILFAAAVFVFGIASASAQIGMSMADCQKVYGADVKENTSVGWDKITFYKDSCFIDMFFLDQVCVGVVYRPEYPMSEQSLKPILDANGIKVSATRVAAGEQGVYVVKKGDALSKIAERFGLSTKALANANKLDPKKKLLYGKKLIIPSSATVAAWECKNRAACYNKVKNYFAVMSLEGLKYAQTYETAKSDLRKALGLPDGAQPASCGCGAGSNCPILKAAR